MWRAFDARSQATIGRAGVAGAMLTRFASSGLTVAAFCRREAVSTASFYRWRSQLGTVGEAVAAALRGRPTPRVPADFVDLGPLITAAPSFFELRQSFDGLSALAKHGMCQDPLSGQLFVFINRRANS